MEYETRTPRLRHWACNVTSPPQKKGGEDIRHLTVPAFYNNDFFRGVMPEKFCIVKAA